MFFRAKLTAAVVAIAAMVSPAAAQDYPSKPVTIVVPYSPGGGNDILARVIAPMLEAKLGQRFLVENKPGAGSAVGTAFVAQQPADGYTLLFSTSQLISTNLTLKEPNYKISDFTPIGLITQSAEVLTIPASLKINTVDELIAYAKANPGKVNYGSVGIASNVQVISAIFAKEQGLEMTEVPFGGGSDVMKALRSGDVQVYFGSNIQTAQAGGDDLKFIAISGEERSAFLPNIPTFKELGYPNILSSAWSALFVRADTPAPVLEKLRTALHDIVNSAEAKDALTKLAMEPYKGNATDFEAVMKSKQEAIEAHIKAFNIQPQ